MAQIQNIPKEDLLLVAIKNAISSEAERLLKEAAENVKNDLEKRTPEIIASLIVQVMGMTEFQTLTDRIVFTIKKV